MGTGGLGAVAAGGEGAMGGASASGGELGSGGDGAAAGAAGAPASGCVDCAWEAERFRGGAALIDGELTITWGNRSAGEGEPLVMTTGVLEASGEVTARVAREGIPGGWMDAMGYSPSGDLVAALWSSELGFGEASGPELTLTTIDPAGADVGETTHVAWDGEAFTIDLRDGGTLLTTRRSPDGEPLLAPVEFGVMGALSYVGYDLGYKSSTNPVSGRTFAFSADTGRTLAGHERSGERIAWISESGALDLPAPPCDGSDGWGVVCEAGAGFPAVAADPEGGVWLAWSQSTVRTPAVIGGVQHYDADGNAGPFLWYSTPEDGGAPLTSALLARSATEALLVVSTGNALYAIEIAAEELSAAVALTGFVPNDPVTEGYRELELLSDGGDLTWVVFEQDQRLQSLRLAPGCVYPPDPAPESIVEW